MIVRSRKSSQPSPRKPDTIASVLYVASKGDYEEMSILDSLRGLSVLSTRERDDAIEGLGVVYAMGVVEGDGLRIYDDRRIKTLG